MNNKTYLITNWKMQLLNKEAVDLTTEIVKSLPRRDAPAFANATAGRSASVLELILCPSFTALESVGDVIKKSNKSLSAGASKGGYGEEADQAKLGAQDVFYHEQGAYTGEVSPEELKELGVKYVIVGHSERRQHLSETDEDVNRKINMCLDNDLTPIMCVGETFDERRQGFTDNVLIRQITRGLEDVELKGDQKLIIAYEPVWAISPAPAAEPQDAEDAAQVIKHLLLDFFEPEVIDKNISIIYGGSVDAENVKDFIKPGLLDGVLVGGASLSAKEFVPIIKAVTGNS